MAEARYGSLPFAEQIEFFRSKANVSSRTWTELWQEQHDHGFMVAGAMRRDLLQDFRSAVDRAISEGTTIEQFRKDFDDIVSRHGWSYNGGRGWRTRVIYDTNLRQSYNAGRTAQMKAVSQSRPYWRYRHNLASEEPRERHLAWDGMVLRHDDPWWNTHTPQNGWGCKCYIETVADRDLEEMGKDGPDTAPEVQYREVTVGKNGPVPRNVRVPEGIDPGFAHQPRRSWVENSTPRPLGGGLNPSASGAARAAGDALPAPRAGANRLMEPDLPDEEYVGAFLDEFDVASDGWSVFRDAAGEPQLIAEALFRQPDGELMLPIGGRPEYTRLLAGAMQDPDEIWEDWIQLGGQDVLRRRYVARWQADDQDILTVLETGPHGWAGTAALSADEISETERQARRGQRVWRREE